MENPENHRPPSIHTHTPTHTEKRNPRINRQAHDCCCVHHSVSRLVCVRVVSGSGFFGPDGLSFVVLCRAVRLTKPLARTYDEYNLIETHTHKQTHSPNIRSNISRTELDGTNPGVETVDTVRVHCLHAQHMMIPKREWPNRLRCGCIPLARTHF